MKFIDTINHQQPKVNSNSSYNKIIIVYNLIIDHAISIFGKICYQSSGRIMFKDI